MTARRGRGPGSFFVVLGCVAVLGGTFALGALAGRYWSGFPAFRSATTAKTPRERGRERETRPPETPPTLTFYQELTAPLAAPPPARPVKPSAEAPKPEPSTAPPPAASPPREPAKVDAPAGRFTVQVGAYKAREPADTLRARLTAAGHDAYVVEADAAGGVRFRVRVGAFTTREAAQEAAARIAADRFATFVTAR